MKLESPLYPVPGRDNKRGFIQHATSRLDFKYELL